MELLISILVAIGIIWLVQTVLDAFAIQEPAKKIIFVVAILLVIFWLVGGRPGF